MPIQLSESEAMSILDNKANKAKALSSKVLNYLGAQKGSMMKDGTVVFLRNGTYELLTFDEFATIAYQKEAVISKEHSIESIISQRETSLNIFHSLFKNKKYDYSLKSIEYIDKDIIRLQNQGYSDSDLFIPLVTYIGEVFIHATNGKWGSNANNTGTGIIVIGEDNREYDPYIFVRKVLVNKQKPFSIYAAVMSQLK